MKPNNHFQKEAHFEFLYILTKLHTKIPLGKLLKDVQLTWCPQSTRKFTMHLPKLLLSLLYIFMKQNICKSHIYKYRHKKCASP